MKLTAALPTLLLFSAGIVSAQPTPKTDDDHIKIHFLDVGSGSCQLVECPGDPATTAPLLIDCGSRALRPALARDRDEVKAYVDAILAAYPDPIVALSHGDQDHYRFVPNLVPKAKIVWFGARKIGYGKKTKDWFDAQESLGVTVKGGFGDFSSGFHNNGAPVADLACGDAETFVLTVNKGIEKNSRSMVLRIEHGDFSVTFSGDAEEPTQNSVIANFPGGIETTVLTASHHGAETEKSNEPAWATATSPEVVIYSAGVRFYHPLCSIVGNYRSTLKSDVSPHPFWCGDRAGLKSKYHRPSRMTTLAEYTTAISGVVTVESDGTNYTIECGLTPGCG